MEKAAFRHDDLGHSVRLSVLPARRVVSLVPSLTEAVATTAPTAIVGATAWCTHPPDLPAERIGGTKNPDIQRILTLRPDVVLANEEENREPDLAALREAGVPVWVTKIRTVDQALRSLDRMLTQACGLPRPAWLDEAEAAWSTTPPSPPRRRAIIPIWRRPWMVLGRDTFAGDVLRRLGIDNIYADHPDRYPKIPLDDLRAQPADLVVLPDEPYAFTPEDGPEAFPHLPAALLSGRHLTWYGPSLATAPDVLTRQLAAPLTTPRTPPAAP
jgi:ABC-type Fe3+-hydroxamate transport system substrate-binding protein